MGMQIDLEVVLYICGGILTVSSAAAIITKVIKSSISKICTEVVEQILAKKQEEEEAHYKQLIDSLEKKLDKRFKDLENRLDKAVQDMKLMTIEGKRLAVNMACIRIDESHAYFTKLGYIPTYEMSLLEDIFSDYEALGGNHMAESQMIDLRALPSSPPLLLAESH